MSFILSLTSIPARFAGLGKLLYIVNSSSIKPEAIRINIPEKYNNPAFGIPNLASIPSDFEIVRTEVDWGPGTKVIPTIADHKGKDIKIIYIDDDRNYSPQLFEDLLISSEEFPNCAICTHGVAVSRQLTEAHWKSRPLQYRMFRILSANAWNPKRKAENSCEDLIAEGYGGVLVKPSFFTETLFEFPPALRSVDDVWISANLAFNHVQIQKLKKQLPNQPLISEGLDIGMLNSLLKRRDGDMNRFQANESCIKYSQEILGVWNTKSNL